MDITLSMTMMDRDEPVIQPDIIHLSKSFQPDELIRLSFAESKQLLKTLQQQIVELQASQFIKSQKRFPSCEKKRRLKEHRNLYHRTDFDVVSLLSPRLYYCHCEKRNRQSFSVLNQWLPEHVSPELQYPKAKWASLMSYNLTGADNLRTAQMAMYPESEHVLN
jgi:hypothetical protein